MACKFAPHNLSEVWDAVCYYINKGADINNITVEEIMNYIKGPDFPTGCKVVNQSSLKEFYSCGKGTIKMQGKYKIEKPKNSRNLNIIFYEVPYNISKEKLISKIADLCARAELSNIVDIRDETTQKAGIRFVIETSLKEEEEVENLVNALFDKTDLETSFSINQNALVNGVPMLLNLIELIDHYTQFQLEVLLREYKNEYDKLSIQHEKLSGLLIALENIDEIIRIIKSSENRKEAKDKLIDKYSFSEIQVNAILDMRLSRLTKIDGVEVQTSKDKVEARLNELKAIINSKDKLNKELITRIRSLQKIYGDARRTEIADCVREKKSVKKNVVDEKTTVLITAKGEIKRVNNYKKTALALINSIETSSLSTICLFTEDGVCHKIAVKKIPLVIKNSDKGERLIDFGVESNILLTEAIENMKDVLVVTKQGYCKILEAEEFSSNRSVKYANLKEKDKVMLVTMKNTKELKVKTSKKDRVLKDFSKAKRTALGYRPKDWAVEETIERI